MNRLDVTDRALPAVPAVDVVVIDDEESMCEGCRQTLEFGGYHTLVATNGASGIELVEQEAPSVVVLDLKMPGMSGMEILSRIPDIDPSIVAIVITGYSSIDNAVESMKVGAFDFITKPFEPEKLLETVRRGINLHQLRREAKEQKRPPRPEGAPLTRQDALLKGLALLGEYYALGLDRADFFRELRYLEAEARYHAESLGQLKKREKAILDVATDLRDVDAIIQEHDGKRSALIQIMLDVQKHCTWLPRHVIRWISARLNVPSSQIYRIANFYEAFSLEPQGAHTVQVCTGTACHVRGAPQLLSRVSALLGIEEGQTDAQQQFTLKTVHCMGCCAMAPVIQVDGVYHRNPTMKELKKTFSSLTEEETAPC